MIKVAVPIKEGVERGEKVSAWIDAKPHVISEYSVYPVEGPANLNFSVVVGRNREHYFSPIERINVVTVTTHGDIRVLYNGKELDRQSESMNVGKSTFVCRYNSGINFLTMGEGEECILSVAYGERVLSLAKLAVVSGEEENRLIEAEKRVDTAWLAQYTGGTSDFG